MQMTLDLIQADSDVTPLLFKLVEVFQARENNLLARLLNLACEKDFVQDGVDLGCRISFTFPNHVSLVGFLRTRTL
jgi:hypothetical protein